MNIIHFPNQPNRKVGKKIEPKYKRYERYLLYSFIINLIQLIVLVKFILR